MTVEGLILWGFIGAALVFIFLYTGRKSQNVGAKIFSAVVIIVILLLELWPFIKYALAEPSLDNIVEIFENLSSFLISSIGGTFFYALSGAARG